MSQNGDDDDDDDDGVTTNENFAKNGEKKIFKQKKVSN